MYLCYSSWNLHLSKIHFQPLIMTSSHDRQHVSRLVPTNKVLILSLIIGTSAVDSIVRTFAPTIMPLADHPSFKVMMVPWWEVWMWWPSTATTSILQQRLLLSILPPVMQEPASRLSYPAISPIGVVDESPCFGQRWLHWLEPSSKQHPQVSDSSLQLVSSLVSV